MHYHNYFQIIICILFNIIRKANYLLTRYLHWCLSIMPKPGLFLGSGRNKSCFSVQRYLVSKVEAYMFAYDQKLYQVSASWVQ